MSRKVKAALVSISILAVIAILIYIFRDVNFALFNPKGEVAQKERWLLVFMVALASVVVVPVFVMTIFFAMRYSEKNKSKKVIYKPDWHQNLAAELVWWGIPIVLIAIVATVSFYSTHDLDPYKPLSSNKQPVRVQVVALDWKWLFIYPEENIASVSYLQVPVDRPINFEITSDGPMNSFWIPQLGGQIYAMNGMSTKLHLIAEREGTYKGLSANISGQGFADMKFNVKATSEADFNTWTNDVRLSPNKLSQAAYDELARPSVERSPLVYGYPDKNLYNKIINKYFSSPIAPPKLNNSGVELQ